MLRLSTCYDCARDPYAFICSHHETNDMYYYFEIIYLIGIKMVLHETRIAGNIVTSSRWSTFHWNNLWCEFHNYEFETTHVRKFETSAEACFDFGNIKLAKSAILLRCYHGRVICKFDERYLTTKFVSKRRANMISTMLVLFQNFRFTTPSWFVIPRSFIPRSFLFFLYFHWSRSIWNWHWSIYHKRSSQPAICWVAKLLNHIFQYQFEIYNF